MALTQRLKRSEIQNVSVTGEAEGSSTTGWVVVIEVVLFFFFAELYKLFQRGYLASVSKRRCVVCCIFLSRTTSSF